MNHVKEISFAPASNGSSDLKGHVHFHGGGPKVEVLLPQSHAQAFAQLIMNLVKEHADRVAHESAGHTQTLSDVLSAGPTGPGSGNPGRTPFPF
jgi:hypothetical protein